MFPRIDKGPIEYFLTIKPAYNTEKRAECLRFEFETNEEFHHFEYMITIDYKIEDSTLDFTIKGLKPRGMTMPSVGRARTSIDLFDLKGKYDVTVAKPGQIQNSFTLSVRNLTPKILKDVPKGDSFLQVLTDEYVSER